MYGQVKKCIYWVGIVVAVALFAAAPIVVATMADDSWQYEKDTYNAHRESFEFVKGEYASYTFTYDDILYGVYGDSTSHELSFEKYERTYWDNDHYITTGDLPEGLDISGVTDYKNTKGGGSFYTVTVTICGTVSDEILESITLFHLSPTNDPHSFNKSLKINIISV